MQPEDEMRDGSLEWIAFGFGGEIALLGEAEPHGLDVGAGSVLGGGGIAEGNGFDEVLVLLCDGAGVWEAVVKTLLVQRPETVPDRAPSFPEQGNIGEVDDGFVELKVRVTKGTVVTRKQGVGKPF